MTMAQRILARSSGNERVEVGDIVMARVDTAMSHENAGMVMRHFRSLGIPTVWDPSKIVIVLDHRVPAESESTAALHKEIRQFVREQGISNFYDVNVGICHQVLAEKGYSRPGILLVGTDSHTTTAGALSAFATGVGATDMAAIWATGEIWLRVPETIKIELTGSFGKGVYAKDMILHVIGTLGADGADYRAVEFHGPAISDMTISSRMVMSNLSMEMGAKAAMFPPDRTTLEFVRERSDLPFHVIHPDPDAEYLDTHYFDLSDVGPQVACPHAVDNVVPVEEVVGTTVDQAVIGSCTNGRLEDLEDAARVLEGRSVHPDVRLIVIPASREVYLEALRSGAVETFLMAGAMLVNPGCGPCLGAHEGVLASGEVAISSTNRNFQGRMGSPDARIYLASPATVAASAIRGEIADPRDFL